jgi:hypothetical protein
VYVIAASIIVLYTYCPYPLRRQMKAFVANTVAFPHYYSINTRNELTSNWLLTTGVKQAATFKTAR